MSKRAILPLKRCCPTLLRNCGHHRRELVRRDDIPICWTPNIENLLYYYNTLPPTVIQGVMLVLSTGYSFVNTGSRSASPARGRFSGFNAKNERMSLMNSVIRPSPL